MLFVFRPWVVRVRSTLKYLLVHFFFVCFFFLLFISCVYSVLKSFLRKVLMMLLCSNDCCTHTCIHASLRLFFALTFTTHLVIFSRTSSHGFLTFHFYFHLYYTYKDGRSTQQRPPPGILEGLRMRCQEFSIDLVSVKRRHARRLNFYKIKTQVSYCVCCKQYSIDPSYLMVLLYTEVVLVVVSGLSPSRSSHSDCRQ